MSSIRRYQKEVSSFGTICPPIEARSAKTSRSDGSDLDAASVVQSDLDPIEMSLSKRKSILRKEKIRDVGKLHEFFLASGKLFSSIECENCFRHAGHGLR